MIITSEENIVTNYGARPDDPSFDNRAAFEEAFASGDRLIYIPDGTYYFLTKNPSEDYVLLMEDRISLGGNNAVLKTPDDLDVGVILMIDTLADSSVKPYSFEGIHFSGGLLTDAAIQIQQTSHFAMRDVNILMTKALAYGVIVGEVGNGNAGWWMGEMANCLIIGAASPHADSVGCLVNGVVTGVHFDDNRFQRWGTGFYATDLYYSTVNSLSESCTLGFEFSLARDCVLHLATEFTDQPAIFRATTALITGRFTDAGPITNAVEFGERAEDTALGNVCTIDAMTIGGTSITNQINITKDVGEINMPLLVAQGVVGYTDIVRVVGGAFSPSGSLWRIDISDAGVLSTTEI